MIRHQINLPHTEFTSGESWWNRLSRELRSSSLIEIQRHKDTCKSECPPESKPTKD